MRAVLILSLFLFLSSVVLTLLHAASIDPSLLSVGGNAGKVNTFTGVDVGNLTNGVFNLDQLLANPQALSCYLYQVGVEELIPTQLGLIYKVLGSALDFVSKVSKNRSWDLNSLFFNFHIS